MAKRVSSRTIRRQRAKRATVALHVIYGATAIVWAAGVLVWAVSFGGML
jgi:hypothetical protein